MDEQQKPSREQLSFEWTKPGAQETWKSSYDEWKAALPHGQKPAQQDYVLFLIRQSKRIDDTGKLRARLDGLDLKALSDAHFARRSAEDRMLETIADLIVDAREQAEAEVKADMEGLKKSAAFAQEQASRLKGEKDNLQVRLEELGTRLTKEQEAHARTRQEAAELRSETERLAGEIEEQKTIEQSASYRIHELIASLEAAKAEILALKEDRIASDERKATELEAARAEIQRLAEAGQTASQTIAKLEIERDDMSRRGAIEKERAEAQAADLSAKLEEAKQKSEDLTRQAAETAERLTAETTAYMEAKLRIATLEGELKSSKAESAALRDAMTAMTNLTAMTVKAPAAEAVGTTEKPGKGNS